MKIITNLAKLTGEVARFGGAGSNLATVLCWSDLRAQHVKRAYKAIVNKPL